MNLEDVDAREHRSKEKWHAARVGKHRNASLAKVGHHSYQAELLERGVKDSQGEHTPMPARPQESGGGPSGSPRLLTGFAFK